MLIVGPLGDLPRLHDTPSSLSSFLGLLLGDGQHGAPGGPRVERAEPQDKGGSPAAELGREPPANQIPVPDWARKDYVSYSVPGTWCPSARATGITLADSCTHENDAKYSPKHFRDQAQLSIVFGEVT